METKKIRDIDTSYDDRFDSRIGMENDDDQSNGSGSRAALTGEQRCQCATAGQV